MQIEFDIVTKSDLVDIRKLQPAGWPDIVPEFEFYIEKGFCYPIKIIVDNKLVGIGTSILFDKTCWLAHIIVDKDFRKRGIGFRIVERLINDIKNQTIETYLLIATGPGLSIYKKTGFKIVTEYKFFIRVKPWLNLPVSPNVSLYRNEYYSMLLDLDKKISGENRQHLLLDKISPFMFWFNSIEYPIIHSSLQSC